MPTQDRGARTGAGATRVDWAGHLLKAIVTAVVIFVILGMDPLGVASHADRMARDTLVRLSSPFYDGATYDGQKRPQARDRIVVVLFGEGDLPLTPQPMDRVTSPCVPLTPESPLAELWQKVGGHPADISGGRAQWPPCFSEYAVLLDTILAAAPGSVFLDLAFTEQRVGIDPIDPLVDRLKRHGNGARLNGLPPIFLGFDHPYVDSAGQQGTAGTVAISKPVLSALAQHFPPDQMALIGWVSEMNDYAVSLAFNPIIPPGAGSEQRRGLADYPWQLPRYWSEDKKAFWQLDVDGVLHHRMLSAASLLYMDLLERSRGQDDLCLTADRCVAPRAALDRFKQTISSSQAQFMSVRWGFQPYADERQCRGIAQPAGMLGGAIGWSDWMVRKGLRTRPHERVDWVQPQRGHCVYHQIIGARALLNLGPEARQRLLEDKIVLVGANIAQFRDVVSSPVSGQVPGVLWHAMALDNLLVYGSDFYVGAPLIQTALASGFWEAVTAFLASLVAGVVADMLLIAGGSGTLPYRKVVAVRMTSMTIFTLAILVLIWVLFSAFNVMPMNWPSMLAIGLLFGAPSAARLIQICRSCSSYARSAPVECTIRCALLLLVGGLLSYILLFQSAVLGGIGLVVLVLTLCVMALGRPKKPAAESLPESA